MITRTRLPASFELTSLSIGVTGGIGSGKSTLCSFFRNAGFPVVSADGLAKELMGTDAALMQSIISHFGPQSFDGSTLNRKYLADIVFSEPEKRKLLNSLVHPVVIKRSGELIKTLKTTSALVFYEAALLADAGMLDRFEVIVSLTAQLEKRTERLAKRDGLPATAILDRIHSQQPFNPEDALFFIEVYNDGNPAELEADAASIRLMLLQKIKNSI